MSAVTGKILRVNLTQGTCIEENVPPARYEQFLSGLGLVSYYLYKEIPANADALGAENILAFGSGLLTGTPALFSGRWLVAAKSPLTGTFGDANCGGHFSLAIKQCGYDAILFSGISPAPVYLLINAQGASLQPAADVWGKDAVDTEQTLVKRHFAKKRPAVACIGQSGEKLSLISGIVTDEGRLAARSGLGAVMGSKNLKALVLCGSRPVKPVDGAKIKALSTKARRYLKFNLPLTSGLMPLLGILLRNPWLAIRFDGLLFAIILRKWGTTGLNQTSVEWGDAPIKNWAGTHQDFPLKHSKAVSADTVIACERQKYHCQACPIGCGGIIKPAGRFESTHKPEYETTLSFSGMPLSNDWESLLTINELLNRAGMDTISAGGTAAAAFEWFAEGKITTAQTGGLALQWGDAKALVKLIEMMINREGIGDLLADGVKLAAQRLGIQNDAAAIHAGGQEIAMHDPRLDPGFGLHASVEPTPGRHTTGSFLYYNMFRLWSRIKGMPHPTLIYAKASVFKPSAKGGKKGAAISKFINFYNGLGICMFGSFIGIDRLDLFAYTNAAMGWQKSAEDYMQIGLRIQTLRQMFNIKHGVKPKEIRISARALGNPPLKSGANKGKTVDLDAMRQFYWQEIGWDDQTGIPTPQTLAALGLTDLVSQ